MYICAKVHIPDNGKLTCVCASKCYVISDIQVHCQIQTKNIYSLKDF